MTGYRMETYCVSPLERIFPDTPPMAEWSPISLLRNETYSFQIAYRCHTSQGESRHLICAECGGPLGGALSVRAVGLVPSELPCYPEIDGDYERTQPGLFPDPLLPIPPSGLPVHDQAGWRSLWVTLGGQTTPLPAGNFAVSIILRDAGSCEECGKAELTLHIIDAFLPKQDLKYTCWTYFDCIAEAYGVPLFSEEFWGLAEKFVRTAAQNGINTILTPLVTPPLETAWGAYRTPVQLVEIWKSGIEYHFRFDRMRRFVQMCRECGVEYFEICHLFSQWGAAHAPQVLAWEDGEERRIFGWDTDAQSPEYRCFLLALLREFRGCMQELGLADRCLYHVSDEPAHSQKDAYRYGRQILEEALGNVPIIDAMSEFALYQDGTVTVPVPSTSDITPFLEAGVPGLWGYYCCCQTKQVSNRFFSMPSSRNRIIGFQMYRWNFAGFLHWGYNHYNTQQSRGRIDPFRVTDGGLAFPSGDAFSVYPGADGPIESLRLLVFHQGITDQRACRLLEKLCGRDEVVRLLDEASGTPITFSEYPKGAAFLLSLRERINRAIEAAPRGAAGQKIRIP